MGFGVVPSIMRLFRQRGIEDVVPLSYAALLVAWRNGNFGVAEIREMISRCFGRMRKGGKAPSQRSSQGSPFPQSQGLKKLSLLDPFRFVPGIDLLVQWASTRRAGSLMPRCRTTECGSVSGSPEWVPTTSRRRI